MLPRACRRAFALCLIALAAASPARAQTVLRICDDVDEPLGLNPCQSFSEKALTIIQQVLEGLVRFDPQGRLQPALAERWERIDDRTMRFHLRKGVFFHDGEPFDGRSVKTSLERYVDPATRYPGLGFVNTIERVDVVDDHTVDVVTRGPDGLLLNRLAAFGHILPPDYYAKVGPEGFSRRPVGTGAFEFVRWDRGKEIVLAANPRYWMPGRPRIDRLVFKFIPAKDQVKALLDNEVDILTELPGTETMSVVRNRNLRVAKAPTFYAVTASFNLNKGPLADKRVREAINLAVNREDVIRYDLLGNGRPLATTTMPGEEGHNPSLSPYPYDPERARRLLREAGYPKGFTLKVVCKYQGARAFRIIAKQLEEVLGIRMEVTFFSDAESTRVMPDPTLDMMFGGCPDPMAHSFFIQSIFLYSKCPYAVAKNPDYDRRLEEMVATIDPDRRKKLAEDLDRFVYEENLILPIYQRVKTIAFRKQVEFNPYVTGMPYFFSVERRSPHAPKP